MRFWFSAAAGAVLLFTTVQGCVARSALVASYSSVLAAQAQGLAGLDALDQLCQDGQKDAAGLAACRAARGKVLASYQAQLSAFAALNGSPGDGSDR